MVLVAELDQVLNVRRSTVHPVPYVMDVGEFRVGAAGEPATFVTPPDLHSLGITGIASGSPEMQAATVGPVSRDQDLGITGEPACHLQRHRAHDVEFGAPLGPGQERQISVHHHCRAISACTARLTSARAGSDAPCRICPAHGDQGVGHPLFERLSIAGLATRPSNKRALHDDVLVFGQRPRQGPTPIVEAEEAAGVHPGGPLVGLVPGGQRELADLLG